MKVAICDDSRTDISLLQEGIIAHPASSIFDIEVFASSNDLLSKITRGEMIDLIFLDVEMPDINGIELGKLIRAFLPNAFIVFVTNFPQYAIDAYECEAYHYLLKPVTHEKLFCILDKLLKKYRNRNSEYIIKGRFENVRVHVRDILYVEYFNKHVCFYMDTPKKEHYQIIGNLTNIYEKLKGLGFFRCHQAFIVNLEKINRFNGYNAILVTGDVIPISVRNKSDLLVAYSKYHEGI